MTPYVQTWLRCKKLEIKNVDTARYKLDLLVKMFKIINSSFVIYERMP